MRCVQKYSYYPGYEWSVRGVLNIMHLSFVPRIICSCCIGKRHVDFKWNHCCRFACLPAFASILRTGRNAVMSDNAVCVRVCECRENKRTKKKKAKESNLKVSTYTIRCKLKWITNNLIHMGIRKQWRRRMVNMKKKKKHELRMRKSVLTKATRGTLMW